MLRIVLFAFAIYLFYSGQYGWAVLALIAALVVWAILAIIHYNDTHFTKFGVGTLW